LTTGDSGDGWNWSDPRLEPFRKLRERSATGLDRSALRDGWLIAEGPLVVSRLMARVAAKAVTDAVVLGTRPGILAAGLDPTDPEVMVAPAGQIHELVGFRFHRGVLAAARRPPWAELDDTLNRARSLAVLEGINDHENLGSLARSAVALGIDALVLSPDSCDPYYRRCLRVSMGLVLWLPIVRSKAWPDDLDAIASKGFTLIGLSPGRDNLRLGELSPPGRRALVFGAEGPGLSAAARAACHQLVSIPMCPPADSLNLAAAAAIAFQWCRAADSTTPDQTLTNS
jgi:tRNA G18 (ribose-2'-O)-methylase SpoU